MYIAVILRLSNLQEIQPHFVVFKCTSSFYEHGIFDWSSLLIFNINPDKVKFEIWLVHYFYVGMHVDAYGSIPHLTLPLFFTNAVLDLSGEGFNPLWVSPPPGFNWPPLV